VPPETNIPSILVAIIPWIRQFSSLLAGAGVIPLQLVRFWTLSSFQCLKSRKIQKSRKFRQLDRCPFSGENLGRQLLSCASRTSCSPVSEQSLSVQLSNLCDYDGLQLLIYWKSGREQWKWVFLQLVV